MLRIFMLQPQYPMFLWGMLHYARTSFTGLPGRDVNGSTLFVKSIACYSRWYDPPGRKTRIRFNNWESCKEVIS